MGNLILSISDQTTTKRWEERGEWWNLFWWVLLRQGSFCGRGPFVTGTFIDGSFSNRSPFV